MKSLLVKSLGILLAFLLPLAAEARIEAPDHVLYGSVTIFGTPAAMGVEVTARTLATNEVLASYTLGRVPRLGTQFALRIPMDVVNPRLPGRARPGDPIRVFIGSQLAAETVVGAEGIAVRLDLDPQNMGTGPALRIDNVAEFEGNSGTTPFVFPVVVTSTGSAWTSPALVEWQTVDESASGGVACGPGVDYIHGSGQLSLPVNSEGGQIVVQVCGDTVIEPDETFLVTAECIGCVLATPEAVGTIIDDDDVPELRILDTYVAKPASGTQPAIFNARLSRNSPYPASFSFQTADGSALAGVHYQATSGSVSFEAGEIEKQIAIPILPHPDVEPERVFRLQLSSPLGLSLQREQILGFIVDPRYEPVVTPEETTIGGPGGVPGLLNPSAIAIAPGGRDVYVASESGDSLLLFERDEATGELSFVMPFTTASAGLESARLDGPRDLKLSPDGLFLYVAARNDGAINVLSRDPLDGSLSLVEVRFQGESNGGTTISGMEGVMALAMSPDGRHLYAAGADSNGVAVFDRDEGGGGLMFRHALLNGGGGVTFLERPSALVVSADGRHVLVTARNSNALHVFARNDDDSSADFGRLSPSAVHREGQAGVTGLSGAFGVALSGDDRNLYLVGEASNSVVWFSRDLASGALTWRQRWNKGAGIPGLGGPKALRVSEDQRYLFVPGFEDNSFSIFDRQGDGGLSLRQTLLDSQAGLEHMVGPMALATTSDARFVYVVANVGNAIVRLRIQLQDPIFSDGFEAFP